jgi:hypothetical protein
MATYSDYILKSDLKEHEQLVLEQLLESAKNVVEGITNHSGFSISYLAEQNHAVGKYIKVLEKGFRIK